MALSWVATNASLALPSEAVRGGYDSDGDIIFVGRAYHNGVILPAKVIPAKSAAYVCMGSNEFRKLEYEILTGSNYAWTSASGDAMPSNAFLAGQQTNGEFLYIGRGDWHGSLTVGKVHPSNGYLYIPHGHKDHIITRNYEVLVVL